MIFLSIGSSFLGPRKAFGEFNFQTFRNRNSPSFSLLDTPIRSNDAEGSRSFFSIIYHYLHNPVGFEKGEDGNGTLVPGVHNLNLAGEYAPTHRFSFGMDMPLHQLRKTGQPSDFSFGDLRLFARMPLFSKTQPGGFLFSIVPSLYFPTGNTDLFLSNPNGGVGTNLVAEKSWASQTLTANLGADYFPKAGYKLLDYSFQMYGGLGYRRDISSFWALKFEWLARRIRTFNTGDLYLGSEYKFAPTQALTFGASLSGNRFDRENLMYRFLIGIQLSPAPAKVIKQVIEKTIKTVQKSEKIYDCGPKAQILEFAARRATVEEQSFLRNRHYTPYRSTRRDSSDILAPGEKTGVLSGYKFVQDAQVLFAIDLEQLPKRTSIVSIRAFDLLLTLRKTKVPASNRADLLCLLNNKVCSGDLYFNKNHSENIDRDFFSGKEPPNDYFARTIARSKSIEHGEIKEMKISVPIPKLLENSIYTDPFEVLYPAEKLINKSGNTILYFAVAHDLFVDANASVRLDMNVESCTEITPKPSITTEEKTITNEAEVPHE